MKFAPDFWPIANLFPFDFFPLVRLGSCQELGPEFSAAAAFSISFQKFIDHMRAI